MSRSSPPDPSAEVKTVAQALALDGGEVECLCLMELLPRAWLLTDDAAARLAGEQRGYRVHGTIGLLIRSGRRGQRERRQVIDLLKALPDHSTLFIRGELLHSIIQRLEREWFVNG